MGYVFNQERSVAVNLTRLLTEQVEGALRALEKPGASQEEAIHSVRKQVKKIRALFRLVRSELNKKTFRRENAHYRSIGHRLSRLRDATVMINTLDKLRETYPDVLPATEYDTLKQTLVERQAEANHAFFGTATNLEEVADAFRQARLTVFDLSGKATSFSVLAPNLKAIYRRGRRALRVATREPSSHNLHELRKDVKTIWYHTRLLEPVWPGLLDAFGQELGQLGELLGDDHDAGVLAHELESGGLPLPDEEAKEAVLQALQQQRTRLQAVIFPLAKRVFAEKTGNYVSRYRRYWALWQAETELEPATYQSVNA